MEPPVAKTRVNDTAIGRFERWALPRMAARLPAWIVPDTLTALGLVAAVGIALAYWRAGTDLRWLHAASLGFVVHWWADSLDGTLARVRDIRRERYGFFVDHEADAVAATLIFVGIAAGGVMKPVFALGMLIAFLLLMNLVSMVAIARDVFKISFAGGGPTELRLFMIAVNTAAWAVGPSWSVSFWSQAWRPLDLFGLVATTTLGVVYVVTSIQEARLLARMDPPPRRDRGA